MPPAFFNWLPNMFRFVLHKYIFLGFFWIHILLILSPVYHYLGTQKILLGNVLETILYNKYNIDIQKWNTHLIIDLSHGRDKRQKAFNNNTCSFLALVLYSQKSYTNISIISVYSLLFKRHLLAIRLAYWYQYPTKQFYKGMFFIASFILRKMVLTGHESPFTWVTLITKCSFIRKVAEIQPKLDKWQIRSKIPFYWVFELKQRFISESHLEKK